MSSTIMRIRSRWAGSSSATRSVRDPAASRRDTVCATCGLILRRSGPFAYRGNPDARGPRGRLAEAKLGGDADKLGARARPQLVTEAGPVGLDRLDAEAQQPGHLPVRVPAGEQAQDL